MKQLLRSAAYRLTGKRVDERKLDITHIRLNRQDVSYFNLSTNSILSFRHGGELWYFRECPKVRARREYFQAAMDSFFDSLDRLGISKDHFKQEIPIRLQFSGEEIARFQAYLAPKREQMDFLNILFQADQLAVACGFNIWEHQTYGQTFFERFGLTGLEEELREIAVYFLWCMRGAATGYRTLHITRGQAHSCFAAVRAVASKIVAEELGLGELLTDARWCVLEVEGSEPLFGVVSNSAPGVRMADTTAPRSGTLQRALINLNVLDVICRQTDHRPNNYNLYQAEDSYSICAFDNDNPSTLFPVLEPTGALSGCGPMVDGAGKIARPYFDSETARRLQELDIHRLKKRLRPYLNGLQLQALESRIKKLNRAVGATAAADPEFLRHVDQWNDETVAWELNGNFGETYLSKAIEQERGKNHESF